MIDRKDLTLKYFELFSDKNIKLLAEMFSNDVKLIDWEINANGKQEVLLANEKIFENTKTIKVKPKLLAEVDDAVLAKIEVLIDDVLVINVVDVITFNKEHKIKEILAYKR